MPRQIRTFLLITLVLGLFEGLLVFQEAVGVGASRLLVFLVMPVLFFATGVATLVYGGRQEDPKDRAVVYGSSVIPFGGFVIAGAVAVALAMIDNATGPLPR